jgi:MFS family permease
MTAVLVAGVVGGPVSGALLSLDGAFGLAGWQWLFLLEGLPAVVLGFVVLWALPDRPADARWLTDDERQALTARLAEDATASGSVNTVGAAFGDRRVWWLALVYFTIPVALYAVGFWLPQIVKEASGAGDFGVGLLSAIPYAVGAIGMVIAGRHSDRTGERRWHVAIAAFVGGAGFAATAFVRGSIMPLVTLSVAMLGLASMFGPFWTLATSLTARGAPPPRGTDADASPRLSMASARHGRRRGVAAGVGMAASIALINSVGNIGGFVGPTIIGYVSELTQSLTVGLVVVGGILAAGGALVVAPSCSSVSRGTEL